MRAGPRSRRCWFFAFPLPSFRLRHVFATRSDRLRGRSCKAPGFSNLRSDSPLDSIHVERLYLDPVGASDGSSTSGSLGVSNVVRASSVVGLLFHTDSFGQALVLDPVLRCRPERRDDQVSINVGSPTTSHNRAYPVCVLNSSLFLEPTLQFPSAWHGLAQTNHTSEMTEKEIYYVAKSWSNTI